MAAGPPELPPRTRRIPCHSPQPPPVVGTTSAYAENTMIRFSMLTDLGNYLRVRGEYLLGGYHQLERCELPPRTRRIHPQRYRLLGGGGTTSAYAENTPERGHDFIPRRNYLRVRGEYLLPFCLGIIRMELPPRTRRIRRKTG